MSHVEYFYCNLSTPIRLPGGPDGKVQGIKLCTGLRAKEFYNKTTSAEYIFVSVCHSREDQAITPCFVF